MKPRFRDRLWRRIAATLQNYTPMTLFDALPGSYVRHYGALASTDFIACESVKIRAMRSLPVHVMERRDNGRYEMPNHPMSKLLHKPNPLMEWGDLMAWAMLRRDVFGAAYIRVLRDRWGNPTSLLPVLAAVSVSLDKDANVAVYSAGGDWYNKAWRCREDGVIVLKTDINVDGYIGKSIVDMAADDLGLSVDLAKFYRALISDGDSFPGWLETDAKLGKADVDAVHESLNNLRKPENAGHMRIFDRGLKYHEVKPVVSDLGIIEQERFVLEKICRLTHVDMHHVYAGGSDTATASDGYDIDFCKHTLLPEVTAIEQAFQPIFDGAASLGGHDSGLRLKIDIDGMMRGDFTSRMNGYRIAVYAGIFSRARCCDLEDVPWLPGQDKLLQPTAYYVLDADGNPTLPAAATAGTSGQSDGVSGIDPKQAQAHLLPIIEDAQHRITRRARTDGDTERTRDFAQRVMAPIEQAAVMAGLYINVDALVEDAIEEGKDNAQEQ